MIKSIFLNPANLISVIRIFLSIPLLLTMKKINQGSSLIEINNFLFVFLLIALSDILDGFIARKFNFVSNVGKMLDPIADKVCVFVTIIYLCFKFPEHFFVLFILIFLRDIGISVITIYFIRKKAVHFESNKAGKLFMFFIGMTMVLFVIDIPVLHNYVSYLSEIKFFTYYSSWLFFILSTYYYCKRYIKEYN